MPKYFDFKVGGYFLYYTSKCVVEAMHVHASNKATTRGGSAKFWVYSNGDSKVADRGCLSNVELQVIQRFIKGNYISMYKKWKEMSPNGFKNK